MAMTLPMKTIDELLDSAVAARQAARRAARDNNLLRQVWRVFVARGAPIPIEVLERELTAPARQTVRDGLARLDEDDLIMVQDGVVRLAYPLSGDPTAFTVRLPDGRTCFTCCAIDALGMAPMLGQPVTVESWCHHCAVPIRLRVDPEGPDADIDGVVVGRRDPDERRACSGH
ncbi:MAG: hypothetical protein DMD79_11540 [Candidatus Rokuibacteriota bacterium]|nr:MAG: hypothetical protein DMD79_11540 [Candidatus Rokubacteria bacterium]